MRNLAFAVTVVAFSASPAFAEVPVTLIEGLGDHHHPIETDSQEAQNFFDQGLILTFAFNHAEVVRTRFRSEWRHAGFDLTLEAL